MNQGGKDNVFITTIGLAIHSLADGAALGASLYRKFLSPLLLFKTSVTPLLCFVYTVDSFGETTGLGMIVFVAIMLHKAPASVGFGTFL